MDNINITIATDPTPAVVIVIAADPTPAVTIVISDATSGGNGPGVQDLVCGEIPVGPIDGMNATFQSLFPFSPDSLEVFLNGQRLQAGFDYTTSGTGTVLLVFSPLTGENLTFNYTKS